MICRDFDRLFTFISYLKIYTHILSSLYWYYTSVFLFTECSEHRISIWMKFKRMVLQSLLQNFTHNLWSPTYSICNVKKRLGMQKCQRQKVSVKLVCPNVAWLTIQFQSIFQKEFISQFPNNSLHRVTKINSGFYFFNNLSAVNSS